MAGWYFTRNAVFMLVAAILAAIVVPLGFVLFVVAAWNRKQKIEWARRSYSYYLPAVAFLTFNCLLQACTHTASAVFIAHEAYWSDYDSPVLMLTLSVFGYLHPAAHFFDAIVEILVFLCLVNLAQGLVKAQTGSYSFRRLSNAAKLIIVFLLGGLAVYSLAAYIWIQGTGENEGYSSIYGWCTNGYCGERLYWSQMSAMVAEADFASSVTIWVLSLLLAIWSGFILYRNNGEKRIKRTAIIFTICTGLWFLRTTFIFAMEQNFRSWGDSWRHGHALSDDSPAGLRIVNVPLTIWTMFIILAILYRLAVKELASLWVADVNESNVKGIQVNQGFKSFQDIVIPMQDIERGELSSRGGIDSPVTAQTHLPTSPPPTFQSVVRSGRAVEPPPSEPIVPLAVQPQNQDWVRPPSGAPPSIISRATSPPSHEELMGLNHQADGYGPSRMPPIAQASDSKVALQSTLTGFNHESDGYHHQADGYGPSGSPPSPLVYNAKPSSHDESMDLGHQAPESSVALQEALTGFSHESGDYHHQTDGYDLSRMPPAPEASDSKAALQEALTGFNHESSGYHHQADGYGPSGSPPSPLAYNAKPSSYDEPTGLGHADGFRPSDRPSSLEIRPASPPSHEELMGLNHQADGGYTPSAPLPYPEKS